MAELNKDGVPTVGTGIKMPFLMHQFTLRFTNREFSRDGAAVISAQVVRSSINLKEKKVSVIIEQPIEMGFIKEYIDPIVNDVCNIEYVYAPQPEYGVLKLIGCECISHEYKLDYAMSGISHHELIYKFKYIK